MKPCFSKEPLWVGEVKGCSIVGAVDVVIMFSKFEQSIQFSFDCSFHWEYSYTLHMILVLVLGYVVI